jgi:hypothetical protein
MATAPTTPNNPEVNDGSVEDRIVHKRTAFQKMFHEEIIRVTEERSKGFDPNQRLPPQLNWLFNACNRAYEEHLATKAALEAEVATLKEQVATLSGAVAKLIKKDKD